MDNNIICFICQDFKVNVGHETKWCPKNICEKCRKNGHTKLGCMINFENLPLPNEILFKIFGYLNEKDLEKCSQVSERFKEICDELIFKEISDKLVYQDNNLLKIPENPEKTHLICQQLVLLIHADRCRKKEMEAINNSRPVQPVSIHGPLALDSAVV